MKQGLVTELTFDTGTSCIPHISKVWVVNYHGLYQTYFTLEHAGSYEMEETEYIGPVCFSPLQAACALALKLYCYDTFNPVYSRAHAANAEAYHRAVHRECPLE